MTHTNAAEYTDERAGTAPLATIDFARLEKNDPAEIARLLKACTTHGFFYLDFSGSARAHGIVEDKEKVLQFMKEYFAQPFDVKMEDHRNIRTRGFIPVGTFTGVDKGSKECFEHLALARDELIQPSGVVPRAVENRRELFERYLGLNDYATTTILTILSDVFGVEDADRFERHHRANKTSDTILAMLSYPSDGTTHNKHTDIGSLTILFSHEWGLQVVAPETGHWEFVEPRSDHAIINVGDVLRFLSGKKLNSCLHRVVRATGKYETPHRYSLAFLLRPEDTLRISDVEDKTISAKEWHDRKYEIYAASHDEQETNEVLTGGMEKVLGSR